MLSARLLLVRHGQSTFNAQARLQGQADPPLSEAGRREAELLAPALARFEDGRVITSDLRRARETAALLGYPDALPDPRWREIDVGAWAGRPLSEFPGGSEPAWRGGPLHAPDGETWDELQARVGDAVDELVAAGGSWLVICHGGCIRVAVAHVTGADALRLGSPPNASVTVFELGERPRLLVYGSLPDGGLPTGLY
jgi:probable phosphoglycerate mutase